MYEELMTYGEFKARLISDLDAGLKEGILRVSNVVKENEGMLTAVSIVKDENVPAPTLYIERMYKEYMRGTDYEEIRKAVERALHSADDKAIPNELIHFDLDNREDILKKIVCRVVGVKENQELLAAVPHKKIMDMAITYNVFLKADDNGMYSMKITNELFSRLDIDIDELHTTAMENSQKLFPEDFFSFSDRMGIGSNKETMYILTNKQCLNGAACAFYPEALQEISERLGSDFFLLPSSIHEMIIVPDTGKVSISELRKIVKYVNETAVDPNEMLTNSVYQYSRKEQSLTLCKENRSRNRGIER